MLFVYKRVVDLLKLRETIRTCSVQLVSGLGEESGIGIAYFHYNAANSVGVSITSSRHEGGSAYE